MEKILKNQNETREFASSLARELKAGDVVALYGDLGSGKTTFTSFLVSALGIEARVQSPTFVIARRYTKSGGGNSGDDSSDGGITQVNHVDLYRLTSVEEVEGLGVSEMFEEANSITVIEWPKLLENLLPKNCIKIKFEYVDENSRKVVLDEAKSGSYD